VDACAGQRDRALGRNPDVGGGSGVDHGDGAAAEHLETVAVGKDRGVLVDAQAELVRVERDRAEQPVDPATLGEVLVDQHPRQELQAGPGAHAPPAHPAGVTLGDHRAGHHGGAGAGAAQHHVPVGHQRLQQRVGERAAQHRGDPFLVAAGEEHAGGLAQDRLDGGVVGLGPAGQAQCLHVAGAPERLAVFGLRRLGFRAGRGDHHDPRVGAAGQLHEALEQGRPRRPADDQETSAARIDMTRHRTSSDPPTERPIPRLCVKNRKHPHIGWED
jgi:hypothetical protein